MTDLRSALRWIGDLFRTKAARQTEGEEVRILALLPSHSDAHTLHEIAAHAHWHVDDASNLNAALGLLARRPFALVLCDRDLPGSDWRVAMRALLANAPRTRVILTSPVTNDYLWQEVIERGGYDVLTRPFQTDRVVKAIDFATGARQ